MSTANKLTYLNGTKQAIKQAINEDFEVIDNNTTFREYADEISSNNAKYKDLIPKETKNATNTLDISNSAGLDKALVTQYGNTYQEGEPTPDYPQEIQVVTGDNTINICGKNLFNGAFELGGIDINSGNNDSASDRVRTKEYIPVQPNTEYTISGVKASRFAIFYDSNKGYLGYSLVDSQATSGTITTLTNTAYIRWYVIQTNTNVNEQLELGTTATTYAPYQSASYPISLGVENLWNTSKLQSGFLNQSGSYPTTNPSYPNARYRLVYLYKGQSITAYKSTTYSDFRIRYIDVDTNLIVGTISIGNNNEYASSNVTYQSGFNNGTITALKDVILGLFDFSGNLAEATITYGTKIQTITDNPIELCKISTYKDRIYPLNGKWYLNKQIGKVVLDGSESWSKGSSRPFYTLLINDVLRLQSAGNNATLFCNYLSPSTPATIWGNNINGITNLDDSNAIRIRIQDDPYTITTFKEWLNDVKPVVYYVLATPTTTEITENNYPTLYNQLNNIKLFEGVNHITMTNESGLDVEFDITYYKDWKLD